MNNFTNGAIVFRIWRFDGTGEVLGKFQYAGDAETFAKQKADDDRANRPDSAKGYFYLAVCENECSVKAFQPVPLIAQSTNTKMTEDQVKHMVNRFLGWRLPKPWNPDGGVSYTRPNYAHPPADHDWPVGTNLFDAEQATAMVRHMMDGMPENSHGVG